jgi:hypothetical protein
VSKELYYILTHQLTVPTHRCKTHRLLNYIQDGIQECLDNLISLLYSVCYLFRTSGYPNWKKLYLVSIATQNIKIVLHVLFSTQVTKTFKIPGRFEMEFDLLLRIRSKLTGGSKRQRKRETQGACHHRLVLTKNWSTYAYQSIHPYMHGSFSCLISTKWDARCLLVYPICILFRLPQLVTIGNIISLTSNEMFWKLHLSHVDNSI